MRMSVSTVSVMAASSISGSLPSQSVSSPVGSWTLDTVASPLACAKQLLAAFMTASEVTVEPDTPSISAEPAASSCSLS